MADSVDVKVRDGRGVIAENDPLFELTRIMGFSTGQDAAKEAVREPVDPQIAIEDNFSLDLEEELQLDAGYDDGLLSEDAVLEDDFSQSFDEELSRTMQMGDATPSVVPSLEDELSALLADEPTPVAAAAPFVEAVEELNFDEEVLDEVALDDELVDAPQLEMDAEPWLDASVEPFEDDLSEIDTAAIEAEVEPVEDPVLSQMNRIFGRSNLTPVGAEPVEMDLDVEPEVAEFEALDPEPVTQEYEPELEIPAALEAGDASDDPFADMANFDFEDDAMPAVEVAAAVEPEMPNWDEPLAQVDLAHVEEVEPVAASAAPAVDLGRLVGRTELEPVVETVDIEDDIVVAMDDLEIPDYDAPSRAAEPAPNLDLQNFDVDDEYTESYQGFEPAVSVAPVEPTSLDEADLDFESMLDDEINTSVDHETSGAGYLAGAAATVAGAAAYRAKTSGYRDEMPNLVEMNDDLDMADDRDMPALAGAAQASRKPGWMMVAGLGALLVLGGGAFYAFSGPSSGGVDGAPVLVKADPEPVKVAPENPSGKTIANQDQAVYDKVGGAGTELPSQGQLVSESEEPVDIAAATPAEPEAKADDRVEESAGAAVTPGQAADTLAVSPKKVRTVIVKPDGTLVERPAETIAAAPVEAPAVQETTTQETTALEPAADAPAPAAEPAQEIAAVSPTPEAPAVDPTAKANEEAADVKVEEPAPAPKAKEVKAPAIKVVKTKKIKAPAAELAPEAQEASNGAPVLEERPSDQPVNIVGSTAKNAAPAAAEETQVAAADASPTPTGSYSIQIASTPSPEAAKATFAALNRKFSGVLGGRGVNVQKAEVAGKGTVYRVRIPAGSKQEAAALCKRYESAGGSCFVTK